MSDNITLLAAASVIIPVTLEHTVRRTVRRTVRSSVRPSIRRTVRLTVRRSRRTRRRTTENHGLSVRLNITLGHNNNRYTNCLRRRAIHWPIELKHI